MTAVRVDVLARKIVFIEVHLLSHKSGWSCIRVTGIDSVPCFYDISIGV